MKLGYKIAIGIGIAGLVGVAIWKWRFIQYYALMPIRLLKDGTNESIIDKNILAPLKPTFAQFIADIEKFGWDVTITSSYRSFQQQADEYASDNRNAKPGRSMHNYGAAIDINAAQGTQVLHKDSPTQDWIDSGILDIAAKLGLEWGGGYKNYPDRVHFQSNRYSIDDLYAQAVSQFGSAEDAVGNMVTMT